MTKLHRSIIMAAALSLVSMNVGAEASDWDRLAANMRETHLDQPPVSASRLRGMMETVDDQGCFTDLTPFAEVDLHLPDAQEVSKTATGIRTHLSRAAAFARAYSTPGHGLYQDRAVAELVRDLLRVWVETDLRSDRSWFWRHIGFPNALVAPAILMEQELRRDDPELLEEISGYLAWTYREGKRNLIGANGMDAAYITLAAAVLGRDRELLDWSRQSTVDLLAFRELGSDELLQTSRRDGYNSLTEDEKFRLLQTEGLQVDGSFNQHNLYGRQMYLGGYGVSFMEKAYRFHATVLETEHSLDPEDLLPIQTCYLEFLPWVVYKGAIDPSQLGRYNVRNFFSQEDAGGARKAAERLADTGRRFVRSGVTDSEQWVKPLAWIEGTAEESLYGNRMFYTADFMVHRMPGFYASIRMTSDRTVGNEAGHNWGNWNYHTGDGALLVLREPEDYYGWSTEFDGRHFPGTTVRYREDEPMQPMDWTWQGWGGSPVAGGVSSGEAGVSGFLQNRGGVHARKSYFFLPDGIIVTGSHIKGTESGQVVTTIEWVSEPEDFPSAKRGQPFRFNKRNFTLLEVDESSRLEIAAPSDKLGKGSDARALLLNHGTGPTDAHFAYAVWPQSDTAQAAERLKQIQYGLNEQAHWVMDSEHERLAMAFYDRGSASLDDGTSVAVNRPCFLLFTKTSKVGRWTLAASSPVKGRGEELVLTVEPPELGRGEITQRRMDLPAGVFCGSPVNTTLELGWW